MKVVAIIAARMGSTRLPGKVLMKLNVDPVLGWVIDAARKAKLVDEVWVATSTDPRDDLIEGFCQGVCVPCYRGSEQDVLLRFTECARKAEATTVVRLTGDCPFLDPAVIDEVVLLQTRDQFGYVSNIDPPSYPDGLDVEAFSIVALEAANVQATRQSDRDCLTQFMQRNRTIPRFSTANVRCPVYGLHNERWVLDTQEDLEFCRQVANHLYDVPSYRDIVKVLDDHPELREINANHGRNERFYIQRSTEPLPERSFAQSQRIYKKALTVQPYGASTYSKSAVAYGTDAPLYISHGDGGVVYDVDGNEYVDFTAGLGSVVLGHRDPVVDHAIRDQLDRGINFGLGSDYEVELCEHLALLPAGDNMVVLGKNGSDVTAAAVRIARAYTGRSVVVRLKGSYHGWHDWALGFDTQRNTGIEEPQGVGTALDISEAITEAGIATVAAVIVEPDRFNGSALKALQDTCNKHGTLLIYDEVFTGMRAPNLLMSRNQHVKPDLTCIGKGMANGMPLSAVIGRKDVLKRFAPGPKPNAFYSTTMGGEMLSIVAGLTTLYMLGTHGRADVLQQNALAVEQLVAAAIKANKAEPFVRCSGAPFNRLTFDTPERANKFRREMAQQGVLIYASFNVMVAHNADDLERLERALEITLDRISKGEAKGYHQIESTIMRR